MHSLESPPRAFWLSARTILPLFVLAGLIGVPLRDASAHGTESAPAKTPSRGRVDLGAPVRDTESEPVTSDTPIADLVSEIRIVGNDTISTSQIAGHLGTRIGRRFDRSLVQRDVRQLANLGWFIDVKPLYKTTPQGHVVIFEVVERPTIRYVTYLGNEKISDKNLKKQTNIKAGGAVDPYAVEEGRRKIEEHYKSRGFNDTQVTILEGAKATDKGIVYLINEGFAQRVWKIDFIGNEFVSDGRLKTLIKSKPPKFKVFKGYVDREQIEKDVDQLTVYYRSFGFFQAEVSRKIDYNQKGNWVNLTFVIREGLRYQIRSVKFLGNGKFEPIALAGAAKLKAGMPFEQTKVLEDAEWLRQLYGSHGYVFADVRPEPVFLEEPGEVDLIYHIEEGEQFRIGRILVHIGGDNPHTRIQTALNRMTVRPGDIVDIREIKASERRLLASSLFHSDAAANIRPKITYRISDDSEYEFAKQPRPPRRAPSSLSTGRRGAGLRGQSPDHVGPRVLPPPGQSAKTQAEVDVESYKVNATGPPSRPLEVHVHCESLAHYQDWLEIETQAAVVGRDNIPRSVTSQPPQEDPVEMVVRGQSPRPNEPHAAWWARRSVTQRPVTQRIAHNPYQNLRGQSPSAGPQDAYAALPTSTTNSTYGGRVVGATGPASKPLGAPGGVQPVQYSESIPPPAGSYGPSPGFSANPVPGYQLFPDGRFGFPGQPYPEQTVDIIFEGQETQTGRLMLGVGVNSNAGVVGNIVLDERNFDWRRFPRSFEDIRNGTALRGGGQRFRIDASPGSIVNRYLVSFTEPYLFDSPISLGLSGSLFDRRFRDWDESRIGGRISVGRQWIENDLSANISYRGESVEISDAPNAASVPELAAALGDNTLHGFRLTVINDTRDSSFLPTQGRYLEMSGEYVTGTFDYPRIKVDFRRYFLLRERPDHSGRHVLSASTNVGWLGDNAPIYEHFFAGGFSTMRGFDFRGASPVDIGTGVEVGGEFQWLNSVQYLFPITADEMLHGVVFSDFGTVESRVEINDFRVVLGAGLRVTVPAMGPAPIALDFGWAINKAEFDDPEVFSFSMGFSR